MIKMPKVKMRVLTINNNLKYFFDRTEFSTNIRKILNRNYIIEPSSILITNELYQIQTEEDKKTNMNHLTFHFKSKDCEGDVIVTYSFIPIMATGQFHSMIAKNVKFNLSQEKVVFT